MAVVNDPTVTLVGNAATQVEYRETATGGMARFRLAVTPRRWDRVRETWVDGRTSFYTVLAWRGLARNLAGSVAVGEPLLVHGRLRVREGDAEGYRDTRGDDGGGEDRSAVRRWTSVEIDAVAVGHDLSRGTAAFRRAPKAAPPTAAPPLSAAPPPTAVPPADSLGPERDPRGKPAPGPAGDAVEDPLCDEWDEKGRAVPGAAADPVDADSGLPSTVRPGMPPGVPATAVVPPF
ncbi:single-stranded DNA-binding protein [Streptomyces clavuligerus]|nr:single-stranded DNA-binding protein [Streptomyces clavuligerus]